MYGVVVTTRMGGPGYAWSLVVLSQMTSNQSITVPLSRSVCEDELHTTSRQQRLAPPTLFIQPPLYRHEIDRPIFT